MGLTVSESGPRIQGLRVRASGPGFKIHRAQLKIEGFWFKVYADARDFLVAYKWGYDLTCITG